MLVHSGSPLSVLHSTARMNRCGHVTASVCPSVRLTRAVAVCGGLGDGARQRAAPRLRGEFVELLLLLHKLDLLGEKEEEEKFTA